VSRLLGVSVRRLAVFAALVGGLLWLGFWPLLSADAHDRRWTALPSGGAAAAATTGPVTLYVDPNGSDAFDCSSADAGCATIQGAWSKLPSELRHVATINLAAGTFSGAYLAGVRRGVPASAANGAYIRITGTLANSTLATGTATGSATSVTAPTTSPVVWGTLNDTGQSWTVNDLRGRLLVITSGAGAGVILPIVSNTATTVTVPAASFTFTAGSGYAIQDSASIISTNVSLPASATGAASANYGAFLVDLAEQHGQNSTGLFIEKVKLSGSGRGIVISGGGGDVSLYYSQASLANSVLSGLSRSGGFTATLYYSALVMTSGTASFINMGASSNAAKTLFTFSTFFRGAATSAICLGSSGAVLAPSTTHVENFITPIAVNSANEATITFSRIDCSSIASSTGIGVGSTYGASSATNGTMRGQGRVSFGGVDVSNCTTAVRVDGNAATFGPATGIVSGTGNTTGWWVQKGGSLLIKSTDTLTGTTEINLEGTAYTLAALRAAGPPKRLTDASTGAVIWEP
jgi:hypothetical protein